jgi:hypothetical protein
MSTLCRTGGPAVFLQFRAAGRAASASSVKWGVPKRLFVPVIEGQSVQQLRNFGDDRNKGWCVFCGGPEETRDHAPSRVFLDEPCPENLPVVPACNACNRSFSLDEEYLACLVECAKTGSINQARITRPKIAKTLSRKASLETRLALARYEISDRVVWKPEDERVRNVIVKLARGHVAFEQNEPQLDQPASVTVVPLCRMTPEMMEEFQMAPDTALWPEVGSRAMNRILVGVEGQYPWIEVQPERYRYLVASAPFLVRIVIAEYLAAEVVWD